ncbi:MAG: septal ring lytic transglycosylase RlpA family protein [Rubrobacteraceae bacterium]
MVGTRGALPRRFLVFFLAALICSASLLYGAGTVRAEQLVASWYGPGFAGLTTASGEPFNPNDYTAASKTLPFGTKLIITYNGKSVVVRINDRGPYVAGRDLDLSQAAAEYIGLTAAGAAPVDVAYADTSTPTGPYTAKAANSGSTQGGSTTSDNAAPAAASPGGTSASPQPPAKDQYAAGDQYAPSPPPVAPTPAQDQYALLPPAPSPNVLETPPPDLVKPDSTVRQRIVQHLAAPPKGFENLPEKTTPTPPPAPAPRATTQKEQTVPPVEETTARVKQVKEPAAPVKEVTSSEQGSTQQKSGSSGGAPGITVLPDTGGVPLGGLIGGSLLLISGAALIHRFRN